MIRVTKRGEERRAGSLFFRERKNINDLLTARFKTEETTMDEWLRWTTTRGETRGRAGH